MSEKDKFDYQRSSIIFVDEDDIPEIVLNGINGGTASNSGYKILTINKEKVSEEHLPGYDNSISYLPSRNRIHSEYYRMGGCDYIYSIKEGKWKVEFEGDIVELTVDNIETTFHNY